MIITVKFIVSLVSCQWTQNTFASKAKFHSVVDEKFADFATLMIELFL